MIFFTQYEKNIGGLRKMVQMLNLLKDMIGRLWNLIKNIVAGTTGMLLSAVWRVASICVRASWWVVKLAGLIVWRSFWWCVGSFLRAAGVKKGQPSAEEEHGSKKNPVPRREARNNGKKVSYGKARSSSSSESGDSDNLESDSDGSSAADWERHPRPKLLSQTRGVGRRVVCAKSGADWGWVKEDRGNTWLLSTGRHARKSNNPSVWKWAADVEPQRRKLAKREHKIPPVRRVTCRTVKDAVEVLASFQASKEAAAGQKLEIEVTSGASGFI